MPSIKRAESLGAIAGGPFRIRATVPSTGHESELIQHTRPPSPSLSMGSFGRLTTSDKLSEMRRNPRTASLQPSTSDVRHASGCLSPMAARTKPRNLSNPGGPRVPGSETLRAGSTAILGMHPSRHQGSALDDMQARAGKNGPPLSRRGSGAVGPQEDPSIGESGARARTTRASCDLKESEKMGSPTSALSSWSSTTASGHGDAATGSEPTSPSIRGSGTAVAGGLNAARNGELKPVAPPPKRLWSGRRPAPVVVASEPSSPKERTGEFSWNLGSIGASQRKKQAVKSPTAEEIHTDSPFFPSEEASSSDKVRNIIKRASELREKRTNLPPLAVQIPGAPQRKDIRHIGGEKIYDLYYWEEVLQESGDGGKVVVCKSKESPNSKFTQVMKIRSKASLREQYHEEEFRKSQIRMLNFPPHIGVMRLREVIEDDNFYYIIMDKAKGGSFFESLLTEFNDGFIPHAAIKNLMRQILEAVEHVHGQGMLHRDIKPDNLVMQWHDDPSSPKGRVSKVMLIDFDHADPEYSPVSPSRRRSCYGTMRFNAPETFLGEYSERSDLYSVGTVLYLLMAGKMPYSDTIFEDEKDTEAYSPKGMSWWMDEVYRQMKLSRVDFDCSPWPEKPDCMNFCKQLLAFDPAQRLASAEEALAHEWFASKD